MMNLRPEHLAIEAALRDVKQPRLLCSFGKDSLLMVHLLVDHGVREVLYLEDGDEVVDHEFHEQVIERYDLHVTRLPAGRGIFLVVKGQPFFLAFPFVTRSMMMPVPTNVEPWKGEGPYQCIDERLTATRGVVLHADSDLLFLGQKIADFRANACRTILNALPEPNQKEIELFLAEQGMTYVLRAGPDGPATRFCAPLKFWTDTEVWTAIRHFDIPWSRKVYDDRGKRRATSQIVTCFRCHDPASSVLVYCPKVQTEITNFAALSDESSLRLLQLEYMRLLTPELRKELAA